MFRALLPITYSLRLLACVALVASSGAAQAGSQYQAVILQYHHVSTQTPASTSISPLQFAKHLDFIASQGFRVLPLAEIVEGLTQGTADSQKNLAITFDDGYLSIYQNAFPELKRRQLPFTIFISPHAIDKQFGNSLSWSQLKEMQRHGATIANHSYQHLHLLKRHPHETVQQWRQRITKDIQLSRHRLSHELNSSNSLFAYPYGEFDHALKALLKTLDYVAFAQQSGPVSTSSDPQALPRFPASGIYAKLDTLAVKLNSLAFHIVSIQPHSQLRQQGEAAPTLRLRVKAADVHQQQAQCFYMGTPIPTRVTQIGGDLLISAQRPSPLNPGRSRYNCTAPSLSKPSHYWYSMPFINQPENGHWQ
ncbi:MAG: polysaccharide deacetylase family protein, partial [Bermanella sp.]